jgi:cell division protein FtsB
MYRLLSLILLVLLVALQMKLWQGEGSWTAEQDLQRQVEDQRLENAKLKERNAALAAEVQDLKSGEVAVEERARVELGMIKPGETFYRVVEPQDPKSNVRPEDVPEDAASAASPSSSSSSSVSSTLPTSSTSSVSSTSSSATSPTTQAPQAPVASKNKPAAKK